MKNLTQWLILLCIIIISLVQYIIKKRKSGQKLKQLQEITQKLKQNQIKADQVKKEIKQIEQQKKALEKNIYALSFEKKELQKNNFQTRERLKAVQQQDKKAQANYNTIQTSLTTATANKQNLDNQIQQKKKELKSLTDAIIEQKKKADNAYQFEKEIVEKRMQTFRQMSEQAAESYFDTIQDAYKHAEAAHAEKMSRLKDEMDGAAADLETLKRTRAAAYQALLKQQEVKQNKDNYRLIPSKNDLQDIHSLERIKTSLHKPRILSMLIWQTYWQPIAKKQFPVILQGKTKMGIYKITNLQTNEAYIGQSVDIYKRWSDHCKAGLGIDTPVGNKLYQAMIKYGLDNFTFELLCQCEKQELDEKERYFISLYQADTFGYNGNIGNK